MLALFFFETYEIKVTFQMKLWPSFYKMFSVI